MVSVVSSFILACSASRLSTDLPNASDRASLGESGLASRANVGGAQVGTPTIWTTIADGTTAVESAADSLGFVLSARGTEVPDALVAAVMPEMSLRTWPEMAVVPTTLHKETLANVRGVQFRLVPLTPLSGRWYAIRFDNVPQGVVLASQPQFAKTPSGPTISLFRVGSAPQLLRVVTYAVKNGEVPVRLVFSEPVRLPPGDGSQVLTLVQSGKRMNCQVGPPKNAVPSALDPNIKWGTVDSSWTGRCSGADPKATISVEIAGGFETLGGVAVAGLPFLETFDPSLSPSCAGACWVNEVFASRGPK